MPTLSRADMSTQATLGTSPVHSNDDLDKASVKHLDVAPGEGEDERAVALRLARAADPGPSVLSRRGIQFVLSALVVCACSGDTGFDGTIMSAVNSMDQFHRYFGFDPQTGADKTGIVFVSVPSQRSWRHTGSLIPALPTREVTLTTRVFTPSVRCARSSPASTFPTRSGGGTPCSAPTCCSWSARSSPASPRTCPCSCSADSSSASGARRPVSRQRRTSLRSRARGTVGAGWVC